MEKLYKCRKNIKYKMEKIIYYDDLYDWDI